MSLSGRHALYKHRALLSRAKAQCASCPTIAERSRCVALLSQTDGGGSRDADDIALELGELRPFPRQSHGFAHPGRKVHSLIGDQPRQVPSIGSHELVRRSKRMPFLRCSLHKASPDKFRCDRCQASCLWTPRRASCLSWGLRFGRGGLRRGAASLFARNWWQSRRHFHVEIQARCW